MGHTRLGQLPRTRKWQQVVALIDGGAGVDQVANATMNAAERAFLTAAKDAGLVESLWLLTQLPLAARKPDFPEALRAAGVQVSDSPSMFEVIGAVTEAIDRSVAAGGRKSDMGEMAQMAAVESLSDALGKQMPTLFSATSGDVQHALSTMATNRQFSVFARGFFARLTNKYLQYFLSRTLPSKVGEGRRFTTLAQQSVFSGALDLHCKQASAIVEEFSGGWFSKTNWEKGGISRDEASRFVHVAMKKLAAELQHGAQPDVQ